MGNSQVPSDHIARPAKNAIINGDMRIAQRGTSFVPIAHDAYSLDRWTYFKNGIMIHTATQDSSVPNNQFNYSLKLDCTTADASIAAGDYCTLTQKIEGFNFRKFVGQTATFSFWVKAGKTGTMCVSFSNGGFDRSYVSEVTINSADTWEKKTITLDFDFSGGTWNYTNTVGLHIFFTLASGSTFQSTADAWQSGNYFATANQTNFVDNTDATGNVWFTGVQLELGSVATDFEFVDYGIALAQCQRYYWRFVRNSVSAPKIFVGVNDLTTSSSYSVFFPVPMRIVAPTFSTSGDFGVITSSSNYANAILTFLEGDAARGVLTATRPSGTHTRWNGAYIRCNIVGGYFALDAEL